MLLRGLFLEKEVKKLVQKKRSEYRRIILCRDCALIYRNSRPEYQRHIGVKYGEGHKQLYCA